MLTPGDGIALAGVAGVIMVGLMRWLPRKTADFVKREECKEFVQKDACDSHIKAFLDQLHHIQDQLDDINKFLRGK